MDPLRSPSQRQQHRPGGSSRPSAAANGRIPASTGSTSRLQATTQNETATHERTLAPGQNASPRTPRRNLTAAIRQVTLIAALVATSLPTPTLASWVQPPVSWQDIDALRNLLIASGSTVVQRDCNQRGLQGLYHSASKTIVICRVHGDRVAVWNTLAHEATHRMQACAGGTITQAGHHSAMATALATYAPLEWRSLKAYPAREQLGELEARYTAHLPPAQVLQLFRRYCGSASSATLSQRP